MLIKLYKNTFKILNWLIQNASNWIRFKVKVGSNRAELVWLNRTAKEELWNELNEHRGWRLNPTLYDFSSKVSIWVKHVIELWPSFLTAKVINKGCKIPSLPGQFHWVVKTATWVRYTWQQQSINQLSLVPGKLVRMISSRTWLGLIHTLWRLVSG